jgi:predicted transcriptional regulator
MEDIIIYSWMVNECKLKGNDLLVYAIIWQDTRKYGKCIKTLTQFAKMTNSTKRGIIKNLGNLVESGLVEKHEKHGAYAEYVKFCEYIAKGGNTNANV